MQDIGKIGIPDTILKKPGRLTQTEYEVMKQHTQIGYNILKSSDRPILKCAATIAMQHHERWDGKGYPQGLQGEEIHIVGRIIRLVDVFDALHKQRIYKKAWQAESIVNYLIQERGKQFDPKLVDVFIENFDEFIEISDRYPDDSV
jgi:response regulator RpfG family c-di-GMP phosphodiesterase